MGQFGGQIPAVAVHGSVPHHGQARKAGHAPPRCSEPPENLRHEASCLSQCAGEHNVLNLPPGSRLSYRYSSSTHTFLQGVMHKRSGIILDSTVLIEVQAKCHHVLKLQDVQIKTAFESREELFKDNNSLREVLEQHPLQFCLCNGKIPKIFPQQREPTWALNIKRGVLSVLQTSSANSSTEEVDVLGICPTIYQQKGSLLLKTKDLNLCTHRFSEFTALRSVALPGAPAQQQWPLFSKLECIQQFEEGILAEVKCTESTLITPSVRSGSGGSKIQSQTTMKLLRREAGRRIERGDDQNVYESNLLYEKEKPVRQPSEEEVASILQRLCVSPRVNSESADLFMKLVFELQHLSVKALLSLWRRSSLKCRHNWQPLVDALPACATEACIVLMKEMIVSEELEKDQTESFLWSLAFIPEPTAGMIEAFAPLLESPGGGPSAFLAITALVHHFCSMGDACDQDPAVRGVIRNLEEYLGRNCTVHESERPGQVELVLKAIGNAGLAGTSLASFLSSCASRKRNPTEIRLAAIEAFRRIPCAANRTTLVQLYQTYDEDVEIRIASYLMSLKCPSEELFNQIKWTLQEEKSSQVGSFVWSHLSQILETNDPLKQDLKNSLPDDILSKEFDGEAWKFSSYSDATFHSASVSANADTRLIFSPSSFIPRMIATNLTIYGLRRAVNLLELGIRLENVEDVVQKFFGLHPVRDNKERNSKVESPEEEAASKVQPNKQTTRRYAHRNGFLPKDDKSKLKRENLNCPGGQYNKMSELVKKFTKRMGKRKEPKCNLSIKIFGNELLFLDCGHLRNQVKHYYLDLAELGVKLLKGQEVQFNKRLSLATEQLLFPAISGLPVLLALNALAAVNVTLRGNVDFKQRNNFFVNGYIKPSAIFQISAQMGTVGFLGQAGLKWATSLRSSTSLDGGIQAKKGKEFKLFLNTPEDSMEIVYFSSQLFVTKADGTESVNIVPREIETKSCTNEEVSKALGWQLCSEVSVPGKEAGGFTFPVPGPTKAAVTLKKQDRRLHQYLMKAAYNYVSQKGSWIPDEAGLHFFMGTPKSELKRDIAIDLHFNIPQKKLTFVFVQPKKKLQMNGEIEVSRHSRVGHLELIVDDSNVYYVKGRIDLQMGSGEQRYVTQLEAKLLRHGSPIVLSGNVTKQPGKKMAVWVSLINLLKDAAVFSVCLEKKTGDTLKQYSLEGETHIPGILGSHLIGLMQQRGSLWSSALRIKYGLFEDAKNLRQECNTAQKLKAENGPPGTYKMNLEHEFYCTQILAYNHKVHLHHEETASQLHSKLEVNYGKHWDEFNNKKRVLVSQTFKNNSNPNLTSYFMEFTAHVSEKEVDYRTQLQHSHSAQSFTESSTHFKVQYNNRLPFVAGLQWKDSSRPDLRKWEGTFNMDTPWLYLYAAHKLHQLHRSTYSATTEFTAGKAFVIKGLAVEIFCRDKEGDKEGRLWIHTPTTTYLRASTVNRFEKNILHSQTEIVSLWNQLIKNEIRLENSEYTKFLHFKIKSAKQEFNISAAYFHLEAPKKTNVSMWVLWTDNKNLPVMLDVGAQIEEVRKEKMFYQKQGILHFRHLFKLPIPQSFLLQETFTVDKKEKHYSLETKVLINELEESVQTLTLGYQTENPYICAALAHPYSSKTFPKRTEACFTTRNLSSLQFPRSVVMTGELFSKETKLGNFDWGLNMNTTVNQKDTSQFSALLNRSETHLGIYSQLSHLNQSTVLPSFQAHATTKRYGGNSLNGSFYLHSSGKDLVLLEADFNSEAKKSSKTVGVSVFLKQAILTQLRYLWLQLLGKISPSRSMLYSVMKMSQNSFCLDIVGAKEQKAGLVLTFHASVQHDMGSLKSLLPQDLSLNGSLKCKSNIHEGAVSLAMNQSVYRLHILNRNVLGNSSVHNITATLSQNGSRALPAAAKLRGQLELNEGLHRGVARMDLDKTILCIAVSKVSLREQTGVTGTLLHNMHALSSAGLPTESSVTATYGHVSSTNQTVTVKLLGGKKQITVVLGIEKLHLATLQAQLTASLDHNIVELKNHGVPFTVEGTCYYQNFSTRLAVGMTVQAEEEQLKVELEHQGINGTAGFALYLYHNVAVLLHFVPPVVQYLCALNIPRGLQVRVLINPQANKPMSLLNMTTDGWEMNSESVAEGKPPLKWYGFASLVSPGAPGFKHTAELRGFYNPEKCSLGSDIRASSNQAIGLLKLKMKFKEPYLGIIEWCWKKRSQPKSAGKRFSLEVSGEPQKSQLVCKLVMDTGPMYLNVSGKFVWLTNYSEASCSLFYHWRGKKWGGKSIPEDVQSAGLLTLDTLSLRVQINCTVDGRPLEVETVTAWGEKLELDWQLMHGVPVWKKAGLPARSWLHAAAQLGSPVDLSLEMMSGRCRLTGMGKFGRKPFEQWSLVLHTSCPQLQLPEKFLFNGSVLASNCAASSIGEVASNDTLVQVCNPEFYMEISLRHTWPFLRSFGLAHENQIRIAATRGDSYTGLLKVALGDCKLTGIGELRADDNVTAAEWGLILLSKCDLLEEAELPQKLASEGLFLIKTYNVSLATDLQLNSKNATLRLELSSTDKYTMKGTLSHSLPHLRDLGLPSESSVLFSVTNGSVLEGLLLLSAGSCKLEANGELQPHNRTEWTLEMETDCKILQDLNIPSCSQLTGSIQRDGCRAEFLSALRSGGKEARLEVKTHCQPKVTLEVELRQELGLLSGIPSNNKLSVHCGKQAMRDIHIDLRSGACELRANITFHAENKFRWQTKVENHCKAIQGLGIPVKMDGSGHIVIEKASLDSQVLVSAGDNSLHGLLKLTITNTKQELQLLLTHNIQGAINLGIPAKIVADLISQKTGAVRRRFLQFSVDDKEIAEELSLTVKSDYVSLECKLTHNLEILQALGVEDQIEFHVMVTFEMNATQEREMQTVAGQTLIMYLSNAFTGDQSSDPFCCSFPEDVALEESHFPKAINLIFMLQKLGKTAKLAFQGQYNNRSMIVAVDVITGFGMDGSFELTTEVKHSLPQLNYLGLPFSIKLTLLEVLSEKKIEGALKLTCDPDVNLTLVLNAKSELRSEELQIKSHHNMPILLQYFPSVAEISSKVSYPTKEAEGKISLQMENADFQALTKITFTRTNRTQVLQLMHTVPQLTVLPGQLVLMTGYQISKRSQILRGSALWNNSKEIKFISTYRRLFPKVSGGHAIKVEICHPLLIPFPQHSTLNMYVEHSVQKHRDDLTIGWDDKEQVVVSSSLKFGREHVGYHARIAHPFNFTWSQIEVNSLTESRRGKYNQQVQLGWNSGQESYLKITFRDKSKVNVTLWDACVAASSSQLQDVLTVGNLQACGSIEQSAAFFHQHLDMKWDGKRVTQNLTYEKSRPLDKIQVEAILENVFLTSCSNQNILGKVETDYSAWLHYYMNVGACGLPNAIALSGKHQLSKRDFFLQSEGKLSLAGEERSITVALKNYSDAEVKNYSVEFALKAWEALWLDVTGSLTSSAVQSQVLVEGKMDAKEKLKLAASKGKKCLRYYMGYLKGDFEDGLELSACVDGQQRAVLNAYLVINGVRQEDMGQLALEATNRSLTLNAYCRGNPLLKAESRVNEITSDLQHRLVAKIKSLEERIWEFRRSVQHIGFLYDAAGWLLRFSQEVAGIIQNGLRRATQVWRQSGVQHALQNDLPLYLGKIQDFARQMQSELQKPLRTLKDAYYDVTSKPWDEVWQERTEEYLRKLQALVPTIVKEVCLMEPIQVSLRTLKTGLDMATQQILSWAEAKISKAMAKIQKPLSNLYSFSARNCSMALRLPVLPTGEPGLDPANITNYLIEEKLMKPLRSFYDINLVAEYYRFKRSMMESPFAHHAMLMGYRHLQTFDGKIYSLTTKCSVLLAKDFVHNTFTIVLNQDDAGGRSLYIVMDGTVTIIYPEQKAYKKYNYSLMEENCQNFVVPFEENDIAVGRQSAHIEVSSTNGASFSCDLRYDLCTLTLEGWHHGASAGIFGTNDNEAGNEWMLPNRSYSASMQEFTHGWQVSSQCSPAKKKNKLCPIATSPDICKTFFQDSISIFRNCFKVVDPEPFYKLCVADMCALHSMKAACTLAAAFVHLCDRNFVPLEMPSQCDGEPRLRDSSLPKALQ
ncbi:uncharacterized protein LOC129339063 [Eublepharis macularius]|uniref:Uncharacterized protein LOC129339063 n=1 Tax=Eublepharis macularius TaxID=481883 RepID=A0AA97K2J0_EUBMA|nr:uncharacterized protein LOC129339063 [Eublepharis macularius]